MKNILSKWNITPEELNQATEIKTVYIPARANHDGTHGVNVKLRWFCPVCGQPRARTTEIVRSYDGSRVLFCDGWKNPCGHTDKYAACLKEAAENGLNPELSEVAND